MANGDGELLSHIVHNASQNITEQKMLAAFLAEPEEGFDLFTGLEKSANIQQSVRGQDENLRDAHYRDCCFACGFDWNPESGAFTPLSTDQIRQKSSHHITSSEDIRDRNSPDQWGHIEFPTTLLHPQAREKNHEIGRALLAGILGISHEDFLALLRVSNVSRVREGTGTDTGPVRILSGTQRLQQMFHEFMSEEYNQIQGLGLDFRSPEMLNLLSKKYETRAANMELPETATDVQKAEKRKYEIKGKAINIWANHVTRNPAYNPENFFLDALPVFPQRLLKNFQEKYNQEAYFGNLEQSYHVLISKIRNLENDGSRQSLAALNRVFIKIINGKRSDRSRKTSERPAESTIQGLMTQIVAKKSGAYSILAGSRVSSSSRGVIVPDPELRADQIRMPWSMVSAFCEQKIAFMASEKYPDLTSDVIKSLIKAGDARMVAITEQILKTRPTLAGRQPTLHTHNMQSFYIQLWKHEDGSAKVEDHAIGWSPMNCASMNADFDGDTVWSFWIPLRKHAQEIHSHHSPYAKPIFAWLGTTVRPLGSVTNAWTDSAARLQAN